LFIFQGIKKESSRMTLLQKTALLRFRSANSSGQYKSTSNYPGGRRLLIPNYDHPSLLSLSFLLKPTSLIKFTWKDAPKEIRTPVLALRGPRPGPLDDGGLERVNSTTPLCLRQQFYKII
jgi:hypothetical protein